ncbi:MAG: YoaP domain-containing protein, partial [Acutalibacteraceae bacterium]
FKKAKELPCVFNNFGAFYNGRFETVNLLDVSTVKKIIGK